MHQIVWFIFVDCDHTSEHFKIIQCALHQRIHSFIFIIQLIRKIVAETAAMVVIFLDDTLKMVLLVDLTLKKMIEPNNDILAQKNKNIMVQTEANFNMAWNAQDLNEFD